ncbi:hypothetical protein cand_017190 [Cryptosporidium andersoni]|uniref:Uncharacterized protein n=1 Tax=Cryptosporidium andersoni TaxID=117008 RepID=A0A1J4MU09_9CRYT|nr:hypothetical protein cand_017190 [Cryptosporidium andersoni]
MGYISSKKHIINEMEVVRYLPKTDRLDTDILSPIPCDDFFDVIIPIRGHKQRDNLSIDVPDDIKNDVMELLKAFGIDDIENKNLRGFSTYSSISPPFIPRIIRYNTLNTEFPTFFDFGVHLTPSPSYLMKDYRFSHPIHPRDNPWYSGCTTLLLLGIPSCLSAHDIGDIITSMSSKIYENYVSDLSIQPPHPTSDSTVSSSPCNSEYLDSSLTTSLPDLGIKRLVSVFTTESQNFAVNVLHQPEGCIINKPVNMAQLEFHSESHALNFWATTSSGLLQCYGHVLTVVPDPSGLRIFAEGLASLFSPKLMPSMESINMIVKSIDNSIDDNNKDLILRFPCIASSNNDIDRIRKALRDIINETDETTSIIWEESSASIILSTSNIRSIKLLNIRLFQHFSFKNYKGNFLTVSDTLTTDSRDLVNTAMFIFDDKRTEPVIIQGNCIFNLVKYHQLDPNLSKSKEVDNLKEHLNSQLSYSDTGPVGFLFKKFEELREALQHDLEPNKRDKYIVQQKNNSPEHLNATYEEIPANITEKNIVKPSTPRGSVPVTIIGSQEPLGRQVTSNKAIITPKKQGLNNTNKDKKRIRKQSSEKKAKDTPKEVQESSKEEISNLKEDPSDFEYSSELSPNIDSDDLFDSDETYSNSRKQPKRKILKKRIKKK